MDWTQTWTVVAAVTGVIALQSFWINRALERIEQRLDSIEQRVVRDHGERLARLEERTRS